MQVCPWCAAGVRRNPAEPSPRSRTPFTHFTGASRNGESVVETFLTATVVGLTAQFVTFIYELTTQGEARLLFTVLLSGLVGLLAAMLAFALIRAYDYAKSARCVRCGLHVAG